MQIFHIQDSIQNEVRIKLQMQNINKVYSFPAVVYLKTVHLLCESPSHSSTSTQVDSGVYNEYETTVARKPLSAKPGHLTKVIQLIIRTLWKKMC
jgi:hypothetical protein